MADGQIIADGPTSTVLKNKALIETSSLLSPQIYQLEKALTDIDLKPPTSIMSKSEMINYLKELFISNLNNRTGDVS